jgi:hypothetical protein
LWFSSCGTPSLMRGWVCNLLVQLLLGIASTVTLGPKSYRNYDHTLLSHLRMDSLFVTSYDPWEVFQPSSMWVKQTFTVKSKLSYDRQSVSQSVLVPGHHLGHTTNFSFSPWKYLQAFVLLFGKRCPLWWEVGSVLYSYKCYWALPALSLSDPSPTVLETISCCLLWDWVPSLSPLMTHRATEEVF